RLYECPGTRFLIKFLNRLDEDFQFVDNVKPFSRFVRIFGASAFAPGHGMLKVAVIIGRMLAYLNGLALHHRAEVMSLDGTADEFGHRYLQKRLAHMSRADLALLTTRLREEGFAAEIPLPTYKK